MKKQWRMMIISGGILAALLLTWLVSGLLRPGETAETTASTAAAAAVFETKAEEISQITVGSGQEGFTLLPEEVKDKDGKISIIWHVAGKVDYPFSADTIEEVASLATLVYASQEIATGVTDFKQYGLEKPLATLTVTLKSGAKNVIKFGNEVVSGYYDYATLDGSGRVCTVASSSVDKAQYTILDLIDKTRVIGIDKNELTRLVFERARDQVSIVTDVTLVGEADSESAYLDFKVVEPVKRSGSSESLSTLATEATAIAVAKFIELDPKDLSKYGLDQPLYTFRLTSADKSVVIKIGKQADSSSYYALSDALPAVFTLAASSFTTIDMKVIEMIDRFVALESIWSVSKVEGNLFGTKFTAEIEITKDQRADDEGVVFKLDGENARIFSESEDSLFSGFYQRIISLSIAGLDTEAKPVNSHSDSLTYTIKEDKENSIQAHTKVIEFTKRDAYTYYVFIDGTYTGFYVDGEAAFTSTKKGNEGMLIGYKKMKYAMKHATDGIFSTEEGYQLD